jgi:hypothetical protein
MFEGSDLVADRARIQKRYYVLLAFAVLHPLSYLAGTLLSDPLAAWHRLTGMLASPRLRSGVLALAALIVVVALATLRTRPFVHYEYWRVAHGPLALVVVGLVLKYRPPFVRRVALQVADNRARTRMTRCAVRPEGPGIGGDDGRASQRYGGQRRKQARCRDPGQHFHLP